MKRILARKNFKDHHTVSPLLIKALNLVKSLVWVDTYFKVILSIMQEELENMSIPSVLAKEKKSTTLQTWDYFIATDFDSILDRTGHLRPLGVIAVNPQQFIEDNFLTLEELIRTVHGFVPSRHFAQIPSGNFRYARVVSCNWWAHTDMG